MLSAMLAVSGCSSWSSFSIPDIRDDSRGHVDFLSRALVADGSARESMWRNTQPGKRSQDAQLRRALMQSVPGHSGYDPGAGEAALQLLLNEDPPSDIIAVARMRLAQLRTELRGAAECRQEVGQLKQRLSRVVNIERKLNQNGH